MKVQTKELATVDNHTKSPHHTALFNPPDLIAHHSHHPNNIYNQKSSLIRSIQPEAHPSRNEQNTNLELQ